jgi:hypothetical protein
MKPSSGLAPTGDVVQLRQLGITHVVNACAQDFAFFRISFSIYLFLIYSLSNLAEWAADYEPLFTCGHFRYFAVELADNRRADMRRHLPAVLDFIDGAVRDGGKVRYSVDLLAICGGFADRPGIYFYFFSALFWSFFILKYFHFWQIWRQYERYLRHRLIPKLPKWK